MSAVTASISSETRIRPKREPQPLRARRSLSAQALSALRTVPTTCSAKSGRRPGNSSGMARRSVKNSCRAIQAGKSGAKSRCRQPWPTAFVAASNSCRCPRTRRSSPFSYHRIQTRPAGGTSGCQRSASCRWKCRCRSSSAAKFGHPDRLSHALPDGDFHHVPRGAHTGQALGLGGTEQSQARLHRAIEDRHPG